MDDRVLGASILIGSLLGIALYFWLVFLSPWWRIVIQLSAFVAVSMVLAIVAWIGYTLATTPPPAPLEEFTEGFDKPLEEVVEEAGEEGEEGN